MNYFKTTLFLLVTMMTFSNIMAAENETEIVYYTDPLLIPQQRKPIWVVWVGLDSGLPGLINANTGIMIDKIGVQGRIGLVYPEYKTAEVSLMLYENEITERGSGWDIKYGYLEYENDIYRYVGAGIRTLPFYTDWYFSGGLQYFFNHNDLIFPVIPYLGIGYQFDYGW